MNLSEWLKDSTFNARYTARRDAELAQTMLANFALDVAGDMLIAEVALRDEKIKQLEQENVERVAKATADHQLIGQLREESMAFRRQIEQMRAEAVEREKMITQLRAEAAERKAPRRRAA